MLYLKLYIILFYIIIYILFKFNFTVRPVNIFSNLKQLICANVCPYKLSIYPHECNIFLVEERGGRCCNILKSPLLWHMAACASLHWAALLAPMRQLCGKPLNMFWVNLKCGRSLVRPGHESHK